MLKYKFSTGIIIYWLDILYFMYAAVSKTDYTIVIYY